MSKVTQAAKSKTIQFSMLLAVVSTVAANMEALAPYFGSYGGLAGVVVAAIIAALRTVTTEPLSHK